MKKYKVVEKQEFLDEIYSILESYDLNDEEKKEVDIFISRMAEDLQKVNELIDKNKIENLTKTIKDILEE